MKKLPSERIAILEKEQKDIMAKMGRLKEKMEQNKLKIRKLRKSQAYKHEEQARIFREGIEARIENVKRENGKI